MPPQPAPDPDPLSLPLDQSHILLTSFNSFLTVAIHNILYYRNIYPPTTFLSTKAYNLPVHQNRHPKVCAWIRDAVDAVAVQLSTGHVSRIAIVIHSPLDPTFRARFPHPTQSQSPSSPLQPGTVLERWLLSTTHFPSWPNPPSSTTTTTTTTTTSNNNTSNLPATAKAMRDFSRVLAKESRAQDTRDAHLAPDTSLHWPDLDEQLRGTLRRMATTAEGMAPLPRGCTFTVAVELKEEGEGEEGEGVRAPIGHPQAWIPSEPNLQPKGKGREVDGEDLGGVRTRPIRSVEAGPLFFECWVEEGKAKEVLMRMMEAEGASQGSTQPF